MTKPKAANRPPECMHARCGRVGEYIISYEQPNHPFFKGQTHNCCGRHPERAPKEQK